VRAFSCVLSTVAADVEWIEPGARSLANHGIDEVAGFVSKLPESTIVLAFEPARFDSGEPDRRCFRLLVQSFCAGTGRVLESDWSMYFRLTEGKVARLQLYVERDLYAQHMQSLRLSEGTYLMCRA
jgi:ketosteroid isomerase-like protein